MEIGVMMKKLIGILLTPYRAWVKAYDKSISEVMEMKEPHRSHLIWEILFE